MIRFNEWNSRGNNETICSYITAFMFEILNAACHFPLSTLKALMLGVYILYTRQH